MSNLVFIVLDALIAVAVGLTGIPFAEGLITTLKSYDEEEDKPRSTQSSRPTEMTSSEYESFWGWGEMPERFWPEEIEKLRREFYDVFDDPETTDISDAIKNFEDGLDDMMGITRLEQRNKFAHEQGRKRRERESDRTNTDAN